jgi:hypothetical protein
MKFNTIFYYYSRKKNFLIPNSPQKKMKPSHTQTNLNSSKLFFCILLLGVAVKSLVMAPEVSALTQGGALLNGSTFSDNNATLTASARAIKWSDSTLDGTVFEFNSSTPTRLKVNAAGDYFIAFTGHLVESASAVSERRIQSEFVVRINGTAVNYGASRCSFIRHSSSHSESSGHIHLFLPGLAANDYLEIFSRVHYNEGNYINLKTGRLFAEKVAAARTVFSAVSTRAQSHATNLNLASASPLIWDHNVSDSGFTHSDSSNTHQITLNSAGKYLVYVNVPTQLNGSGQRVHLDLSVKLGSSVVSGGVASQGYLRYNSVKSSLHWVGLISTASANQILSTEIGRNGTNSSEVGMPSGEKASIFIEKLANNNGLFFCHRHSNHHSIHPQHME